MRFALIVLVLVSSPALAAPPNGYACGDGKVIKDKGCECVAGKVSARDAENNAICVAKPQKIVELGKPKRVIVEPGHQTDAALSSKLELAYTSWGDSITKQSLRVARGSIVNGELVFGKSTAVVEPTDKQWNRNPAWHPNGTLYFTSDRQNQINAIYSQSPTRVGVTRVVGATTHLMWTTLSPDGTKLAWANRGTGEPTTGPGPWKDPDWKVWIATSTGGSPRELGPGSQPAFSPDGKQIAFVLSDAAGDPQIWVMNSDGTKRVQVTKEGINQHPHWHPSGKSLVYSSRDDGNDNIWEIRLAASTRTQLTSSPDSETKPIYTPDGKSIIYTASTDDGEQLFQMRIEQ